MVIKISFNSYFRNYKVILSIKHVSRVSYDREKHVSSTLHKINICMYTHTHKGLTLP